MAARRRGSRGAPIHSSASVARSFAAHCRKHVQPPAPSPVVLVTGAARRLGREIALDLAAHGWDVAVHYRRSAAEAAAHRGRRARARRPRARPSPPTWPTKPPATRWCRPCCAAFGRVDAVVNNASLFEYDDVGQLQLRARWTRHWRANTAPADRCWRRRCTRTWPARSAAAAWSTCSTRSSGTRTRTTCRTRCRRPRWKPPPRCWRRRWRRGCACAAWRRASRCCRATMSEAEFDAAHRMTPLQRSSTPQDIARAVRFLLESPAITGTTLLVDGGQHLQAQPRDVMFLAREPAADTETLMQSLLNHPQPDGLPAPVPARLRGVDQHRRARLREDGRAARADQRRPVRAAGAVDAHRPTSWTRWSTTTSSAAAIAERVARGHIHLQETLADDVLRADAGAPARARRARVHREARRLPRLRRRGLRGLRHEGSRHERA